MFYVKSMLDDMEQHIWLSFLTYRLFSNYLELHNAYTVSCNAIKDETFAS